MGRGGGDGLVCTRRAAPAEEHGGFSPTVPVSSSAHTDLRSAATAAVGSDRRPRRRSPAVHRSVHRPPSAAAAQPSPPPPAGGARVCAPLRVLGERAVSWRWPRRGGCGEGVPVKGEKGKEYLLSNFNILPTLKSVHDFQQTYKSPHKQRIKTQQ